ncbi:DUF2267 domain-containing protein [Sphingomonas sp. DT-207]|uniref:DUF2267 domain-containing protein n=1 Tax=Sphingomonas sp. DT-207 TaxID=3396167 RepID=UPI003F198B86
MHITYDQYEPAKQPTECRTIEEFVEEVGEWLTDVRPIDPTDATQAVFAVLSRHVDPGQIAKVQGILPESIRRSWERAGPEAAVA